MKKVLMFLTLVCILVCGVEVNAACAYGASVNNEFVCLVEGATQGNTAGTAYPENGVLVLKNYNGGSISYSSALGNRFTPITIKLVGDNYITADNSYGIRVPLSGVEFVGDGTLTIKSKLPIAVIDADKANENVTLSDNVTTIKVTSGNKVNENTTTEEDNEANSNDTTNNEKEESSFDLSEILAIVCCVVSVACLLIVAGNSMSNKKDKK